MTDTERGEECLNKNSALQSVFLGEREGETELCIGQNDADRGKIYLNTASL